MTYADWLSRQCKDFLDSYDRSLAISYSTYKPIHPEYAEYPPGWRHLIENLLFRITGLELGPDFSITQIKEKMGGLRVYSTLDGNPGMVQSAMTLITQSVIQARRTCVACSARVDADNDIAVDRSFICGPMCGDCRAKFGLLSVKDRN